MMRLASLLYSLISTTLAGSFVIAALVTGYDTLTPILVAALAGFLLACPWHGQWHASFIPTPKSRLPGWRPANGAPPPQRRVGARRAANGPRPEFWRIALWETKP